MAKTTNKVFFSGRIARPELKHTNSGLAIFTCSLAIDDSYKKKDATEWTEKTIWMNVKAFDKAAERFSALQKGAEVLIEGRMKQDDNYIDKDGNKRSGGHYIDPEKITPIEQIKKSDQKENILTKNKAREDAIQVCRTTGTPNQEFNLDLLKNDKGELVYDNIGDCFVIDALTGEIIESVPF